MYFIHYDREINFSIFFFWEVVDSFLAMSKPKAQKTPSALDQTVINAITEIASGSEEAIKKNLMKIKVASVKEVKGETKVFIVTVPYKQIAVYRQISGYLVPELEKKMGGQVVVVGQRRAFPIKPEEGRRYRVIRPVSRTLRAVNESLLEDVVYPTAIVGKQVHYNLKGKQSTVVFLDANDKTRVEERLNAFAAAYNKLTGLNTTFEVAAL